MTPAHLGIQLVGGPTAVLEYGGLRWLTDPALSPPGEYSGLTKVTGPALDVTTLAPIDVVLLSHHHHADNLDPAGRAFLPSAGRVLATVKAAEELGDENVVGMEPWTAVAVDGPDGASVTVTAVPAQHGPDGTDDIQGPVLGFVLSAPGAGTVYVSGDNASRDVVRAISDRVGDVDVAVLNAGAVQLPKFDGAYLTMSADHAADAAKILGARVVVPLHFEGWTHFTQGSDALVAAFRGNGLGDRLVLLERGEHAQV